MKIRRVEEPQFKIGNRVDCEKDSFAFDLVILRNGSAQPNLAFDLVSLRNGFAPPNLAFDVVTRRYPSH